MTSQRDPRSLFNNGLAYEAYVGRWSRRIAPRFLDWLAVPEGANWLDVGCGTGVLTEAILQRSAPSFVHGVDLSAANIDFAREHIHDARAQFQIGDAQDLPVVPGTYDSVVSGLLINFVPDPDKALAAMVRAAKPGGLVAVYVWDYAGGMQMIDIFWNTVAALVPNAPGPETDQRYPITKPQPLADLFGRCGLQQIETHSIDIDTHFENFDDYWTPYLGGQGSGPKFLMSLDEQKRIELREALRTQLPTNADGSIPLTARVWAVRGRRR